MKFFKIIFLLKLVISPILAGKILHISDIHYDSRYHIGSANNCILGDTGLGCCRKYDIPKKPYQLANEWGDYNCDTPIKLLNESLKWISKNLEIDKIIYTGDSVDHHDISQTIGYNIEEIEEVYRLFRIYFPNQQIFHTLGNHDTYPIDQTPPHIYDKFLKTLSNINVQLNSHSIQSKTIQNGGYFYDYLNTTNKKIKIISLNTMYYDTNNLFIKYGKNSKNDDIKGQWRWLEDELIRSTVANEKVWLLLHIPPSNDKKDEKYKNRLIYYLSKYSETIVATFSGHIHSDNFKLYFNNIGNLVGFGTIPSSLMPNKINPSFRVIEYDKDNGKLLNYIQYSVDLNETIKNNNIRYYVNYNFKDIYGIDDMSKESYLQIYHKMRMNNTVLNQYYTYNKPDKEIKVCIGECRSKIFNNILIR